MSIAALSPDLVLTNAAVLTADASDSEAGASAPSARLATSRRWPTPAPGRSTSRGVACCPA